MAPTRFPSRLGLLFSVAGVLGVLPRVMIRSGPGHSRNVNRGALSPPLSGRRPTVRGAPRPRSGMHGKGWNEIRHHARAKTRGPVALKLLLLVALVVPALARRLTPPRPPRRPRRATDDFNRANGSLGPNWTDMGDAGLAISSQQVMGTSSGASGDIRTGENYTSDQYSQIEITSTQLSGGQWVGARSGLRTAARTPISVCISGTAATLT